jgi:hypothetical protein
MPDKQLAITVASAAPRTPRDGIGPSPKINKAFRLTFSKEVNVKAILIYDSTDYLASATSYDLKFANDNVGKVLFNNNYRYLDELMESGVERISSGELSNKMNVTA